MQQAERDRHDDGEDERPQRGKAPDPWCLSYLQIHGVRAEAAASESFRISAITVPWSMAA